MVPEKVSLLSFKIAGTIGFCFLCLVVVVTSKRHFVLIIVSLMMLNPLKYNTYA